VKGITDNFGALTPWGYYQQMFYLSMSLLNCSVYGDFIPFTPNEQIFDLFAQVWARVLWAFIAAESASLVGALYEAKAV
jgi:Na+/H+-dicarboxylate symporter